MSISNGLDVGGMYQAASMLSKPAEEYANDTNIEAMWAVRAGEYSEIHYNLLCSADPKLLNLTKDDDRLYNSFMKKFPDFKLDIIDVSALKSPAAKEKWRLFCEDLKDLEDFSYGTILRLNCREEYSSENTILVTRVQFQAIEVARNRLGYNDFVWSQNSLVTKSTN